MRLEGRALRRSVSWPPRHGACQQLGCKNRRPRSLLRGKAHRTSVLKRQLLKSVEGRVIRGDETLG